jgi:hypothetical protein
MESILKYLSSIQLEISKALRDLDNMGKDYEWKDELEARLALYIYHEESVLKVLTDLIQPAVSQPQWQTDEMKNGH